MSAPLPEPAAPAEDLALVAAEPEESTPSAPGHARLVRGAGSAAERIALTDEQEAVASLAPGHGAHLVLGAPGTGRTTVAVEYAARRLEAGLDPESLLVLAPGRDAAARLRDALTARLVATGHGTRAVTPVRTWAAYAFDLIRRARLTGPLRHVPRPPRLLSGAEQDTVIAELMDTYGAGLAPAPDWPEDVAEAVDTQGFRREVRELVDRMSEFGVEPGRLQELGVAHGRPAWEAAAALVQDYRDRMDLGMPEAFDPAGLIAAAVRILTERHPEDPERDRAAVDFAAAERARLRVLVVEDLQEAGPAVHDLLVCLGVGADVLLTATPDTTVEGFRGARPDLVSRYPAALDPDPVPGAPARPDPDARTHVLTRGHRMAAAVQEAYLRVARRVRQRTVGVELTRTRTLAASDGGRVEGCLVPSRAHEDQLVLERILRVHHEESVPLDEILVVSRSGARVAALARHLEAEGVPVVQDAAGAVLKDEPAVAPLLLMLRAVADRAEHPDAAPGLDADEVVGLLRGRYGMATALHVRRLRQDLLTAERARGGRRTSDELLVAALADPALAGEERDRHRALRRVAWMHRAGLEAARRPDATAETVLWALWDASGRAERWRATALEEGAAPSRREARQADADLDAVVALFRVAERFVDRFPGAGPADFAAYTTSQDLPADTLARRAETGDAVHVRTPAAAAGRQWHTVIVVGLQEGAWPNTTLRGQLLGATDLADLLTAGPQGAWPTDHRTRLQEVRQDELRMLAAAVSRASERVVATAVRSADEAPSDFLDLVAPVADVHHGRPLTPVAAPLTPGALVARLRRRLEAPDVPEALVGVVDPAAAAGLAVLAADGVAAADPDRWWGLAPLSTDAPLAAGTDEDPVRLSPSKVGTALRNPLDWLLSHIGAQAGTTLAQSVGTLVHSVAEHHPDGPPEAVRAELERRLPELGLPEGWAAELEHARARRLVEAYIGYWAPMRQAGRHVLAQELRIRVPLTWDGLHVVITGVIDRLEADGEGRPWVVDLKTGRSRPTKDELPRLPQLAAYQVAVRAEALADLAEDADTDPAVRAALASLGHPSEPGGAALVQLGSGNRTTPVQVQPGLLAEDTWALEQVFTAARRMQGPAFLTVHDAQGRCALPSVCPLCSEGRQVTEWHR